MKTLTKDEPMSPSNNEKINTAETQLLPKLASNARLNPRTMGTRKMRRLVISVAGIVVLSGVGVGVYTLRSIGQALPGVTQPEPIGKRVSVVLTPAKEMVFESTVVVSGNVQAKNYALVSARMPGSLDAVYVDEGDSVEEGKTKLFQTDSLKLTKELAVAKQAVKVAESSRAEKLARLDQAVANKEQAERDLKRYEVLARDNAVSVQQLEMQQTADKQAAAGVKDVEALIALADAQLEQTRLSLTISEKELADSLVFAPISGHVSKRFKEPGEMAGAGTPVVKIEDLSVLEVSVFLPAQHYAQVAPGETQMRINVSGIDLGVHPVAYKSPTVNSKLRTFEVKAFIESPPPSVAPGCLVEVAIVMDSQKGVGIPTAAIQRRGGQSVVFLIEGEQAQKVQVKTGYEMDGWTKIVEGEVSVATPVLTMGQHLVEDSTPVTVVEESGR